MATGTKVIHFFPAAALVRNCSHFDLILRSNLVSVLDLDNSVFFNVGYTQKTEETVLRYAL
jgi:hypothetical protein